MKLNKPGFGRAITELAIFSTVINAMLLVLPIYLLQIYDRVLTSGRTETLTYITILACFGLVFLGVFEALRGVYAARVANRFDMANGREAFLAGLYDDNAANGDIQTLRDLATLRNVVGSKLVFVFFDLPFAPLFIGLLYFVHPLLFWVTAGGVVVMILLALVTSILVNRHAEPAGRHLLAAQSMAHAMTRNADTLRGMGMAENAFRRWARLHQQNIETNDRAQRTGAVSTGMSRTVRMILQIGVLGFGALLVLRGEMTAGMIFAASIISSRGLQPVDQLIGSWNQLAMALQTYNRLRESFERIQPIGTFDPAPRLNGSIRAERLVYRPPGSGPQTPAIIKGLSFELPAGRHVAIVGNNGAGKSTLARLLVGAIRPTQGFLRFDDADSRSFDPDELARNFGYLSQSVEMIPGTIFENIARFDADATAQAVEDAARAAGIHEEIAALPAGYQTRCGSGQFMPSGGQLQRLGLARALYGQPSIVVLDEPNANLDASGNALLMQAIGRLRERGTTVVVITQRMDILPIMDGIMVMANGDIEQYGPTREIMARMQQEAQRAANAAAGTEQRPQAGAAPTQKASPDQPFPPSARQDRSPFAGFGPGMRPIDPPDGTGGGSS